MASNLPQNFPSVDRIKDLQQLIADFAEVHRKVNLANTGRPENDAEHSFGLALTCWFLAPKIAPDLDLGKILGYALAHDVVEVHSGDTFVYDTAHVKTKIERETAALNKLAGEWPDFKEMIIAAEGYQSKVDAEARFVYVIDKMLPPIMVNLGEKESYWKRYKITREMEESIKDKSMIHSP